MRKKYEVRKKMLLMAMYVDEQVVRSGGKQEKGPSIYPLPNHSKKLIRRCSEEGFCTHFF